MNREKFSTWEMENLNHTNLIIIIISRIFKHVSINAISKKGRKKLLKLFSSKNWTFSVVFNFIEISISFWTNDYIFLIVQWNLHYLKLLFLMRIKSNQESSHFNAFLHQRYLSHHDLFTILDSIFPIPLPFVLSNLR